MTHELIILGKATYQIYLESAAKSFKSLRLNWEILPITIIAAIIFPSLVAGIANLLPQLAAGFLIGLIRLSLISYYFSWIGSSVRGSRLKPLQLAQFDYGLFLSLISISFIFFLCLFVLRQLLNGIDVTYIFLFINLVVAIVFNPLIEIAYLNRFDGLHALRHSYEFVRDNWIEWFLPLALVSLPLFLVIPAKFVIIGIISEADPIIPVAGLVHALIISIISVVGARLSILALALTTILVSWLLLFRGHLFLALDQSSRRRRIYQWR